MKFRFFSIILICICSIAYAADSYQVGVGSTVQINEHGVCKKVINSSSYSIFVGTRTASEWASFYNNTPPAGVAVASGCYTLKTLRCTPFYGVCYYSSDWKGMRCNQPADIGAVGTNGGCHTTWGIYTENGQTATIFWDSNWFYNWECEFRCEYN